MTEVMNVDFFSYAFSLGLSMFVLYKIYDNTKYFFESKNHNDTRKAVELLDDLLLCCEDLDYNGDDEEVSESEEVVEDEYTGSEISELILSDEDLSDDESSQLTKYHDLSYNYTQSENDMDEYDYVDEEYYPSNKFKDVKNKILQQLLQRLDYLNKTCFSDTEEYLKNTNNLYIEMSDLSSENDWSLI